MIGCDVASHDRRIQEVFWLHKAEAYNLLNLKAFLGGKHRKQEAKQLQRKVSKTEWILVVVVGKKASLSSLRHCHIDLVLPFRIFLFIQPLLAIGALRDTVFLSTPCTHPVVFAPL